MLLSTRLVIKKKKKERHNMKVGILGTGWIADKMAVTLTGLDKKEGIELYAVASRSKEKAEKFAADWKMPKAYGSYQEKKCR